MGSLLSFGFIFDSQNNQLTVCPEDGLDEEEITK